MCVGGGGGGGWGGVGGGGGAGGGGVGGWLVRPLYAPTMTMAGALSVTRPYILTYVRLRLSKSNTFHQNFMKLGHIV